MKKKFVCLRSGYCCTNPEVMIISNIAVALQYGVTYTDNDAIDEIITSNLERKVSGERCRWLQGACCGGHSCELHEYPFYKDTPCSSHVQLGGGRCRAGVYLLNQTH